MRSKRFSKYTKSTFVSLGFSFAQTRRRFFISLDPQLRDRSVTLRDRMHSQCCITLHKTSVCLLGLRGDRARLKVSLVALIFTCHPRNVFSIARLSLRRYPYLSRTGLPRPGINNVSPVTNSPFRKRRRNGLPAAGCSRHFFSIALHYKRFARARSRSLSHGG